MLKDNVANIGVGQCGGNYVSELEAFDNLTFYVNTSLDDLDTIETDYSKKYCIEGTKGMAKDTDYADEVITSNYNDEKIAEKIFKKYSNQNSYFFHFGLAGGTGGGMSTQIMSKFKELYPDKIVNSVVVYPNDEEDILNQYNAWKCLERIEKCLDDGVINNLQILNNNSKEYSDKLTINKEFASMFEDCLSFAEINKTGNLDEEEMERLFTTKGVTVIYKIKDDEDMADALSNIKENTIYAPFKLNPTMHGLILSEKQNNSVNRSLIREAFGVPNVTHDIVWENNYSLIISSGIEFNKNLINKLKANYTRLLAKKQEIENQSTEDEFEDVKVDESILKTMKTKTATTATERPTTRGRRSREVGVNSSSSNRYRRK